MGRRQNLSQCEIDAFQELRHFCRSSCSEDVAQMRARSIFVKFNLVTAKSEFEARQLQEMNSNC